MTRLWRFSDLPGGQAVTSKSCRRSTSWKPSWLAWPFPITGDDFVLKGGVLLAAFAVRRPTKDIDLQASGLANDADEVADRVRKVAALEFADVLKSVASFSDPVLTGTASGHWEAPSATWRDH